ncbi:hypothetical protein [Zunongwangia sp. HRR-M8]|uniref:hypothetical protein n=1 Tax=Zunongwangia sp. HRR-M8 TaxID=3015170 RepID=UPI0022DE7571|nr:hypothetical protein [Zunongwangia sp. HRR-M8]WBL23270.1 hypothetical protein PBT89_04780 [Zunongwangia sp. HRR-M8]
MNINFFEQVYSYRELCIKKDLREIAMWGSLLEDINEELGNLLKLEKQMIKDLKLAGTLQAMRRDVILCTAGFCKFEQELQKEFEYGKKEYGDIHIQQMEKHRLRYLKIVENLAMLKRKVHRRLLEKRIK